MRNAPTPQPCDVSDFNRKLAERFGMNRFDGPNVRCVWGDTATEVQPDSTERLTYFRRMGPRMLVGTFKRGRLIIPRYEQHPLGVERFVVEKFKAPETLPAADRQRFPRGRYVFLYEVETTLAHDTTQGQYRPPGDDTLEHVAQILAGQDEADRALDRELERMSMEFERNWDDNAAGRNAPYRGAQVR
jgi:hypothetical protein